MKTWIVVLLCAGMLGLGLLASYLAAPYEIQNCGETGPVVKMNRRTGQAWVMRKGSSDGVYRWELVTQP